MTTNRYSIAFSVVMCLSATVLMAEEPYSTLPTPQVTKADLNKHLAECFPALGAEAPAHHKVTGQVTVLDAAGTVDQLQMFEPSPDRASVAQMRQFLRMDAALSACLPLPVEGPATLRLTAAGNTLRGEVDPTVPVIVVPQDVPIARADVSPVPRPQLDEVTSDDVIPDEALVEDALTESEDALQLESPLDVALEDDEKSLELALKTRAELQTRLKIAGHNPGRPDGIFGPRTRAAVSAWQEDEGLPVSGFLNEGQIKKLEVKTAEVFDTL
ncbi:MAG: peptidoglycan-binding domain-containing protein, partial [Pseudomonadota bacterium]